MNSLLSCPCAQTKSAASQPPGSVADHHIIILRARACVCRNDGLFIGSSAAVNCVGAVKVARALGPGHTVVTVLCDGGARHLSKFHNPEYLKQYELSPEATGNGLDFVHGA